MYTVYTLNIIIVFFTMFALHTAHCTQAGQYRKQHPVDNQQLQEQMILMTAEAKRNAKKMEIVNQEVCCKFNHLWNNYNKRARLAL